MPGKPYAHQADAPRPAAPCIERLQQRLRQALTLDDNLVAGRTATE